MKIRTPIRPAVVVHKRVTYIPHILAVALLCALAMTFDYHVEAAAASEREACANLCKELWDTERKDGLDCSFAIQMRSNEKVSV